MGAYKIEQINPADRQGASLHQLRSGQLERERNEAYAKGFKDGVNVTRDAVEAEQARLLSQVLETLEDQMFSREEAGAAVISSMAPMMRAIAQTLVPEIARAGFFATVEDRIQTAARASLETAIHVEVAPQHQEYLSGAMAERCPTVTVIARPDHDDMEVRIAWVNGFDHINMTAAIEDVQEKIEAFMNNAQEASDERDRKRG